MIARAPIALRSRSFRSDRIAWAVFAVVLLALGAGTKAWLHRRVRVEGPAPSPHGADFRLTVLAYDRIGAGESDRHLAADRLAEHFEALRTAGFQPVSLRQVRAAFSEGAPLPERSVLLTFDGGHLSTYQAIDPLLRQRSWPAVMFLDPRLQEDRHATYVYWDRLQRMVDSGLWEIGTLGPWPENAGVVERRLHGYDVLASVSSRAVEGERGSGEEATAPLAFENSVFGVNDAAADPRRLFRLRVPRDWSGEDLVARLASSISAPGAAACRDPPPVGAARWVAGTGRVEADGDAVMLVGAPRAEAWLAGGEWARDWVFEAEVQPVRGPFWIVQQAVGSREQWRWGGTERTLYLQRLRPGAPVDVVSRVDLPRRSGTWHSLRLVKRGEGVWVEWDGAPVADMPRAVAARWRGHVGIGAGTPTDAGEVVFRNARFAAIPYRVRSISASPPPEEVQALLGDAPCLAAISPPGLVERQGELQPQEVDRQLLAMIAARGAWEVLPAIEVSDDVLAGDTARAAEAADRAAGEGWSGVRLVARPASATEAGPEGWPAAAQAWRRVFTERGLRFVVVDGATGEETAR